MTKTGAGQNPPLNLSDDMPDKDTPQASMYGPLVLAARFEDEPRETWYRYFAAQEKQEPRPMRQFKGKLDDPASWLEPAGGKLAFRAVSQNQSRDLCAFVEHCA